MPDAMRPHPLLPFEYIHERGVTMSVTAHFLPGNGGLPGDSRQAGFEANHTIFYVARAVLEGGVHLGKFRADWHAAAIPYAGQERWVSNYEVWVGKLSPD